MTSADAELFQSHPEAMWIQDARTGRLLVVNASAQRRYGYPEAEFLKMTVDDLRADTPFHPLERELPPGAVRELHRRADGSLIAVEVLGIETEHEGRKARVVTVRDLTREVEFERENREIRALLQSREERYRLTTRLLHTLEGISDGLFIIDHDGRFTFVNHEAERMLQRRADELIGQRLLDVLPAARGSVFELRCREALATGNSASFEEYYPPWDTWFDVRAYPTVEELVVYFHDVTGERAQRGQLNLLETAVSRLNDMIMITEAEPLDEPGPRIIYVNEAFLQITGFSREEVIGRTPRILQGAATSRTELDRIRAALEARRPVHAELVNYTREGEAFRVQLDIVPIIDDAGRLTNFVAVERNITEQRDLEERLRRSQRLDAIGQLTGGVAHDFNNLLTVILGNSDLLVEELGADERLHALALMTRTAAERGAELTRRLLAFARRQNLDPSVTDVNELLGGMYGLLCRTLGEHIEIVLRQGERLLPCMVDGPQLESAVLNLCLNARDAMPYGGRLTLDTGNVRLGDDDHQLHEGEVVPGEYVAITVSDTGTGMPPEIVEHAFEPFFTTKETGKGSGLGLSMVYGFIKQSAGHVKISSEPETGTSVTLYLPSAPEEVDADDTAGLEPAMEGGSERILLVEDDPIVRTFVTAELEELGYTVVSVVDGPSAVEALRDQGPFDLLFTDVVMPGGMNGRELADAAQALHPHLPVLFTSGYTEDVIVDQGRPTGEGQPVQLLHKPYRRAELAAKIRQVLG